MKQTLSAAAVLAAFALTPALAQQQPDGAAVQAGSQASQTETGIVSFAQDAVATMQIANLATDKNTPAAVALLGDRVSLTQGRINQALDAVLKKEGQQGERAMSDEGLAAMKSMTDLNQEQFAGEFVAWIGHTYPRMISTLETWAKTGDEPRKALAATFLPELRNQLQAAQHLTQAGFDSQQAMDVLERDGLPIERKDDPAVLPTAPGGGTGR